MSLGQHVIFNGRLMPASAAAVSPLSEGFMYGWGVFETLKIAAGGQLEFWDEHWARLQKGVRALGLDYNAKSDALLSRCAELIRAEGVSEAGLKIVVFRDVDRVSELISLRAIPYSADQYERGFSLKVVRGCAQPEGLAGLKTLNYLAGAVALRAARTEGFDEVVFVDDQDRVLETATANIFAVTDGRIVTPSASLGILPGVIRGRLLDDRSLSVTEKVLSLDELCAAGEIFITNSLMGVMPVRSVGGGALSGFCEAVRIRNMLYSEY